MYIRVHTRIRYRVELGAPGRIFSRRAYCLLPIAYCLVPLPLSNRTERALSSVSKLSDIHFKHLVFEASQLQMSTLPSTTTVLVSAFYTSTLNSLYHIRATRFKSPRATIRLLKGRSDLTAAAPFTIRRSSYYFCSSILTGRTDEFDDRTFLYVYLYSGDSS